MRHIQSLEIVWSLVPNKKVTGMAGILYTGEYPDILKSSQYHHLKTNKMFSKAIICNKWCGSEICLFLEEGFKGF